MYMTTGSLLMFYITNKEKLVYVFTMVCYIAYIHFYLGNLFFSLKKMLPSSTALQVKPRFE
jgi:hypothetical protein